MSDKAIDDSETAEQDAPRISTRDRILAASFQLFLQHGFDGTGLSQILAATGLSKGAFYHHFPTKEALYREVIAKFFLEPVRHFDFDGFETQALRDSRDILAGAYVQLPTAVAAAGIDMARYFALFFEAFSRLDDFRAEMRAYYQTLLKSLARRSYDQYEVDPKTAEAHAINVISALEGRLFLNAVFGQSDIGPLISRQDAAE